MPHRANGTTPPADDGHRVPNGFNERALAQSRELGRQIADLADRVAQSEDMVASTLEESARLRPHAEERLRAAAAEARRFAEVERDHGRTLRRSVTDDDAEHDGDDAGPGRTTGPDRSTGSTAAATSVAD